MFSSLKSEARVPVDAGQMVAGLINTGLPIVSWGIANLIPNQIGKILKNNKLELADLMHKEMGKTFEEAKGEMDRSINHCSHFAELVGKWETSKRINDKMSHDYFNVELNPLGVLIHG